MVGDGPDQGCDLRSQYRLRGDDPLEGGQSAVVVAHRTPLQHEAVPEPAGEAHPDPSAGNGVGVLFGGHRVVERPVQMRQRQVDHDLRDRQLLARAHQMIGGDH